jgi:hypothetical protein
MAFEVGVYFCSVDLLVPKVLLYCALVLVDDTHDVDSNRVVSGDGCECRESRDEQCLWLKKIVAGSGEMFCCRPVD